MSPWNIFKSTSGWIYITGSVVAGTVALNEGKIVVFVVGRIVVMFGMMGDVGLADGAMEMGGMYDGVTGW